jgi:hypothetical protein
LAMDFLFFTRTRDYEYGDQGKPYLDFQQIDLHLFGRALSLRSKKGIGAHRFDSLMLKTSDNEFGL